MRKKIISSLFITATMALSIAANAAITSQTIIDFTGIVGAGGFTSYEGKANLSTGNCAGAGSLGCIVEEGVVVGVVDDRVGSGEHLHRILNAGGANIGYEADSTGPYIRALDGTAFSLTSMSFSAPITLSNPDSGPNDVWEILGFNTAVNPNLDLGNGTDYTGLRVAYQTVPNGYNSTVSGPLQLNSDFRNVKAVWVHYKGYPRVPVGKAFNVDIDNIVLNAPVTSSAQVPVPAATVWLLGVCLMGLIPYLRRKTA